MTQNENLQRSERNEVILSIPKKKHKQFQLWSWRQSHCHRSRLWEWMNSHVSYKIKYPLETLSIAVIAVTQSIIYAHLYPRIKSATLSVQIVNLPASTPANILRNCKIIIYVLYIRNLEVRMETFFTYFFQLKYYVKFLRWDNVS